MEDSVSALILAALQACTPGSSFAFTQAINALARVPASIAEPALTEAIEKAVAAAGGRGWGRPEVERLVFRLLSPRHAATLSGRMDVRECIETIAFLVDLQASAEIGGGARGQEGLDEKVLGKVRGLLAKAESTDFPDEADALTAKAQELMARHSIDRAMVEDAVPGGVVSRRLVIDDPYARAKSFLLAKVARANRCESMWSADLGMSTVVGFPDQINACELLYTSLLIQADAAMMAAGRTGGSRARSRSFRQSFLVAFAQRIGERLLAATTHAEEAAVAEHGESVLPVLARQSAEVEDALRKTFPHVRRMTLSVNDGAGAVAGRMAADNADLASAGRLTE